MTPSNPTMIREEEDYAAPWVFGEKTSESCTNPAQLREENEEDEEELARERELRKVQREAEIKEYADTIEELGRIAQELQEEEGVPTSSTGPSKKLRLIIRSETDIEEEVLGFVRDGSAERQLPEQRSKTNEERDKEKEKDAGLELDVIFFEPTEEARRIENRVEEVEERVEEIEERVEDVEGRVGQELSRPVNWSSDDEESSDDLGRIKEEVKN
ncbi:hypothetical protein PSHT_04285 [Puccinia striiformis]|uniref:Uncharacterized protein n=1 Tax=Puccinia striiformis TaxID=27350 RepID=A0A2S4WDF0_9BASI|nr:hypothetical protein PSHT_04285 [Puccinia striiformis]